MRRIWSIYIMIILFVALSIAVGTGTVGPHGSVYADDVVVGLPSSNGDDAFLVNNSSGLTLMSIWTDGAVDVEPLGTATSIADQKSSGEFTLFGSYWNGAATEHYFSLQNIASIAEAETGRLAISWDNTELMSILNDGKVGIGSNTPTGKLYVNNKNGTENSFRVDDGDSGDPDPDPTPFVIDQNGWVGIRTEYPSASLDVSGDTILNGSVSLHGLFELFNADNSEVVTMDTGPTGTQFKLYNDGTGFSFRIGDQFSDPTPFIIDDEGNVGIGTPNPGAKLEVNGQVKITDGSEGAGLVLTSDASGLASWQAAGGITETDPVYSTAPASGITLLQIGNWDTAFGWGNHVSAGYLTSYTETDPVFLATVAATITNPDITKWNTAFGWGDHASAGYLTSYTETDPQVNEVTMEVSSVPHWSRGSLEGGSLYNYGSNVGIVEDAPLASLTVNENILGVSPVVPGIMLGNSIGNAGIWLGQSSTSMGQLDWVSSTLRLRSTSEIKLGTGTLDRLTITNGGNVGIGTTLPNTTFHTAGFGTFGSAIVPTTTEAEDVLNLLVGMNSSGVSNGIAFYENTSGFGMKIGYDGTGAGSTNALRIYDSNDSELVTFQNGGNIGIGTTNPSTTMHIKSQTLSDATLSIDTFDANNDTSDAELQFKEAGTIKWKFQCDGSNADRLEIEGPFLSNVMTLYQTSSAGKFVGIANSNPNVALDVIGSIEYTGTIFDVSDENLKENIKPIERALEKIQGINGVYFNMIDTPGQNEIGVIAQNVQKVLPEAVKVVDPENGHLGVCYSHLIPVLIEATKELKAENDELKERLLALEKRVFRRKSRSSSR